MSILLSEITDRNISSVDRFIKVLKYLNQGHSIEIDGHLFKVAENNDEKSFSIVIVAEHTNTPSGDVKEIVLGSSIEYFIRLCSNIPEEVMIEIAANTALNRIKKGE